MVRSQIPNLRVSGSNPLGVTNKFSTSGEKTTFPTLYGGITTGNENPDQSGSASLGSEAPSGSSLRVWQRLDRDSIRWSKPPGIPTDRVEGAPVRQMRRHH